MEIKDLVKNKPYLVWHVDDIDNLSEESIVEAVLNYGNWDDIQKLLEILGTKKVALIFQNSAGGGRSNYRPEIKNFFKLYFQKHA